MPKLIIQIPCYNEEKTLGITLSKLPQKIDGIDQIEYLIIDDGSTDGTVDVAKKMNVHHVVSIPHRGLAVAFYTGILECLKRGADIIVNTDADNQYNADDIAKLVDPILQKKAEIVIGERPISKIQHFSLLKKFLQKLGSWVVRVASQTKVPDATSGFRALSRMAAIKLNFFTRYTYTLEMIIQAGHKGIPITSVPIRVNKDLRPSKLVKNIKTYVLYSGIAIVRLFMIYKPLRFFLLLGSVPIFAGIFLGVRWAMFFFNDPLSVMTNHLPSFVLCLSSLFLGALLWMLGLISDISACNRRILEDIQYLNRSASFEKITNQNASQTPTLEILSNQMLKKNPVGRAVN